MQCKWNNTICVSANYDDVDWTKPLKFDDITRIDVLGCKYRRGEIAHQYTPDEFMSLDGNLLDQLRQYYVIGSNHDYRTYHHCQSLDGSCDWGGEEIKRVRISIERSCNLKCVMCGGSEGFKPFWYSLHKLQYHAMNRLLGYNNNLDQIILTSDGEPFVYKMALFDWLKRVTIQDTKEVYMFTNLTLLTDKDIDMMHQYELDTGVRVRILGSIDGITEPIYRAVRRNNMFALVMANAERLRSYGMLERVNFCVNRENISELPHVKEYWADKGIFADVILLDDFMHPGEREEILNTREWKDFIIKEFK